MLDFTGKPDRRYLVHRVVRLASGDLKIERKGTCMREMVSCVHKRIITIPSYL